MRLRFLTVLLVSCLARPAFADEALSRLACRRQSRQVGQFYSVVYS
jgi:hypothetical protein